MAVIRAEDSLKADLIELRGAMYSMLPRTGLALQGFQAVANPRSQVLLLCMQEPSGCLPLVLGPEGPCAHSGLPCCARGARLLPLFGCLLVAQEHRTGFPSFLKTSSVHGGRVLERRIRRPVFGEQNPSAQGLSYIRSLPGHALLH